ncbi:MAG: SDR family oxidoreductase [Oribacterium sp.]|nr:SDR family oxidoreductase [Oribacterium sp.]
MEGTVKKRMAGSSAELYSNADNRTGMAAVVTGASRGIGRAIADRLVTMGYHVYGIGKSFDERIASDTLTPITFDLTETEKIQTLSKELLRTMREHGEQCALLVNNAGVAYYGLHEEVAAGGISEMVRVDLEAPMLLSRSFLRVLRETKGSIINISSVTALEPSPHAAAYGALKAGLLSFSRSLLAENRKYGVRVMTILPDLTDTSLYRNADFTLDSAPDCHLEPTDVADAVEFALTRREGIMTPEILLRPQKNRIQKKQECWPGIQSEFTK